MVFYIIQLEDNKGLLHHIQVFGGVQQVVKFPSLIAKKQMTKKAILKLNGNTILKLVNKFLYLVDSHVAMRLFADVVKNTSRTLKKMLIIPEWKKCGKTTMVLYLTIGMI